MELNISRCVEISGGAVCLGLDRCGTVGESDLEGVGNVYAR